MNNKKKSPIIRAVLLAAMFALTVSSAVLADDPSQFVPGTKVNGIGVGGLAVNEAKNQVESFYDREYKLTIRKKDGTTETINGSDIGYKAVLPDGLQKILDDQNASGRASGPSVDNSHRLAMTSQYDDGALKGRINGLNCISGSGIVTTADAYITPYAEGQPFTIVPEVQGSNVNVDKTTAAIKAAVAAGEKELDLNGAGCYYTVSVTKDDARLKDLCDTMNRCKDMVITYTFGDQSEVLTGQTICTWIKGSRDGQIDVDYAQAAAYVKTLADKYNTANAARTFRTADGRDMGVNGPYGWKIDEAGEAGALIAMIRTGQSQAREPQYSQKAASRGSDWGNTYVEIDLTNQHVYMFKDGAQVWDAPCVTGNVSKEYTTPAGVYSLTYKETDRILRGKLLENGKYEYESHVNFWMPFNGGIGLHDADWRSKFGGAIYKTSGSHGCINLPPDKAKVLYDLIYKGIPVICYN